MQKNQIVLIESAIIINDLIPNVKSRSEKNAIFPEIEILFNSRHTGNQGKNTEYPQKR